MTSFYILNGILPLEAKNPKDAARLYALAQGISAGKITVVTDSKTFDITEIPRDIQATEE